jgi:hypothetical protein
MELRGAAPDVWDAFVRAIQEYANEAATTMVIVPLEMLPRAQGMAMEAQAIAKLLADAPTLHDKIQAARLGKRHV